MDEVQVLVAYDPSWVNLGLGPAHLGQNLCERVDDSAAAKQNGPKGTTLGETLLPLVQLQK